MKTLALLLMLGAASVASAAEERTVTMDVKDAELRDVLKSMQKQCGIKNMVIDPDVQGSGATLKFRDVPCATAFKVVFRQFGLAGQFDRTVTTVETRKR